jgi:two-component system OmpR family response regulator
MESNPKIKVFLVDDDAVFLKSLEIDFLQHEEFIIETFATGELCLEHLSSAPEFIVLDYHLDGHQEHAMNGIETLDRIKAYNYSITVIMLSSQDKIDVAIDCMHHKAFDYFVKSETAFIRLQKAIETVLQNKRLKSELNWYMERM